MRGETNDSLGFPGKFLKKKDISVNDEEYMETYFKELKQRIYPVFALSLCFN
jgi:hypothetical protein